MSDILINVNNIIINIIVMNIVINIVINLMVININSSHLVFQV